MSKLYKDYVKGSTSLGASFGVLTLLSRWVSIIMLIYISEMLIKYGLLGIIGYILTSALAFILFGFIAGTTQIKYPTFDTIGDIIHQKTNGISHRLMMHIILFASFGALLIQAFGIHIMLEVLFPIPIAISQALFYLACFIYAGLGGLKRILKLEPLKVTIIFSSIILIPVYFFIQQGIESVYAGVRLYHPYLLYWKNHDSISFIATSFLITFGMLMIDRVSWQRISIMQKRKARATFSLTGMILGTIPLALLSMALISLSNKSFDYAGTIFFELVSLLQTPVLTILFITFCIVVATSTVGAEIHATTVLIVNNVIHQKAKTSDHTKYKQSYLIVAIILFVLWLVSLISPENIFQIIFLFGILYSAMIAPMLFVIYSKTGIYPLSVYGIFIASCTGVLIFLSGSYLTAIWISFLISVAVSFLSHFKEHRKSIS
ncbi:hypothetical protein [Virgibacillus sp. MG-45]|uniref:hypothetical protein n=1 Tax=Virgibacillus sp. MG-45 TaxID=3102791 RepID=UPI002ED9451A